MIAMEDIDVYDLLYRCSRLEGQLNDLFNGPKAKLTKKRRDNAEKRITSCVNELDNTYGDWAGSDDKTALMTRIEKIKQDKQREFERDAIFGIRCIMFGSISCEFIDFESLLINNKDFS